VCIVEYEIAMNGGFAKKISGFGIIYGIITP
jgi:hypothetical protein